MIKTITIALVAIGSNNYKAFTLSSMLPAIARNSLLTVSLSSGLAFSYNAAAKVKISF